MDGFSIIFHRISYDKIVTSTIQSRATAGVAGDTYIFCVPGSPSACEDAWDGILSYQLDFRTRPCNFVEIIRRRRPLQQDPRLAYQRAGRSRGREFLLQSEGQSARPAVA
jgi:hypothetical protein